MLATIFEMIEKILGFAALLSTHRLSSRLSLMLSLVLLNKTRKYKYQILTSFLKIDSFLAKRAASPLSVLLFVLTSFDIFRYKYFYT